jgi:hemerythrin
MASIETLVNWSEIYHTGIELIDDQHKELVDLTNQLFKACIDGEGRKIFKDIMAQMVTYVRFHFSAEIKLLEKVNYPDVLEHKKQHDDLIKSILEAVQNYDSGKIFTPNTFVRTLKDWVFTHIAVSDKIYSAYVTDLIKKGLLNNKQIEEFMK